jgi:homoserine kinase type II
MVKRFVPGTCHRVLPATYLRSAGTALAEVHALKPPPELAYLSGETRELPADAEDKARAFEDRSFSEWILRTHAEVRSVTALGGEPTLVHGDFFPDNLVVTPQDELVILDWETACVDQALLDLGMALVGMSRVDGRFVPRRARMLVDGYTATRALSSTEIDNLPNATVYASLVIAYHRYLRHHVSHPDPSKHHLYLEIPRFAADLQLKWGSAL